MIQGVEYGFGSPFQIDDAFNDYLIVILTCMNQLIEIEIELIKALVYV